MDQSVLRDQNFNSFISNRRSNEQREGTREAIDSDGECDRDDNIGNDSPSDNIVKKRRVAVYEKKYVCKHCGKKYFAENKLELHIVEHGNRSK